MAVEALSGKKKAAYNVEMGTDDKEHWILLYYIEI